MKKVEIENSILLAEVERMLQEGHSVVLTVKGFSMRPFLFGDRDSVKLERKESYEVGDIVLAQILPGRWVLHRLIVVGDVLTLKGDGNLDGTEQCRMENIAGYVTEFIKPSGRTVNPLTGWHRRVSLAWRKSPRIFRRVVLKFLRMTI